MSQSKILLDVARRELGIKENPPNSNNVKYNTWYYGRAVSGSGFAWCVVFVAWCFERAGLVPLWLNGKIKETASCAFVMSTARRLGQWVTSGYTPGDCVLFDWKGGGKPEHIGIVERGSGSTLVCIEGNTAVGNDSNGGEVMRRTRDIRNVLGAFRPKFEEDEDMAIMEELRKLPGMANITDKQVAEMLAYTLRNGAPSGTAVADYAAAVKAGITDGSNPGGLVTRWMASVMAYRVGELKK